jgi:hypothetical protein
MSERVGPSIVPRGQRERAQPIRDRQLLAIVQLAAQLAREQRYDEEVGITDTGGRTLFRMAGAVRDFARRHEAMLPAGHRLQTVSTPPTAEHPLGTLRVRLIPLPNATQRARRA